MKKYIIILATILMCIMATAPAAAIELPPATQINMDTENSPRENFVWRYRTNNGVLEKRLWSVAHNCWVTDWMPA